MATDLRTPATGSTAQSTLSPWAGPYVTNMLGKARAIAAEPYQVYQGPMTADTSALQKKFFGGLGSLAFPQNLGKSYTDTGVSQSYMNPYLEQVLKPQMQAMQRQADIQRGALGAQAAKAGAFGGSRAGLMNQQLNADLMRQQQQATGQAYNQAYQQGLGQYNTEQQQAMALANLLGGAGAQQRGIEQEGITADYNEFLAQRDYPRLQTQYLQSMLQGLPIQSISTMQNPMSGIGQFSSTMGALGQGYDLLKRMGVF
jgi:hypothetical protein